RGVRGAGAPTGTGEAARRRAARGPGCARTVTRRSLRTTSAAVGAGAGAGAGALGGLMSRAKHSHIVVVGAGAFGGWTALFLRRQGARVTLLDSWGPGNSRASSGGETRVIRATYGSRAGYTPMAARALVLWKEHQ